MKILRRDDTDHNTEYVTLADAEAEIEAWEIEAETLREERNMYRRERDAANHTIHKMQEDISAVDALLHGDHQYTHSWVYAAETPPFSPASLLRRNLQNID
jgi:uncharacterized protein (DUF3084 family)